MILMKILYIESRLKNPYINLDESEIKKLPKKIFLAYTVQYRDLIDKLKKILKKSGIEVTGSKQILGCTKINFKSPILLIGDGRFHARNLYSQSNDIYLLENNTILHVPYKDIEYLKMKKKTSIIKFLSANNIGILVSTKPGQYDLDVAMRLIEKLKKKNPFLFIADNLNIADFENFNIDSWVNTACPGLSNDSPDIINYSDLSEEKLI
jgi:diphthamide biosynthesis enzyme Dph1/Dph2-like protein